jgi:hypothetical protein
MASGFHANKVNDVWFLSINFMALDFFYHKTSWLLRILPPVTLVASDVLTHKVNGIWFPSPINFMASHFLHHKTSWSLRFPPSVNLVASGVLTNNVNDVWFPSSINLMASAFLHT